MTISLRQRGAVAAVAIVAALGSVAFFQSRPADAEVAPDALLADSAQASPAAPSATVIPDTAVADTAESAVDVSAPDTSSESQDTPTSGRPRAGEDPAYAERMGWPVRGPAPLPGAVLPDNRIVCYYGNPNSTRMGALGEYPKDEMLARLGRQVDEWRRADTGTPVIAGAAHGRGRGAGGARPFRALPHDHGRRPRAGRLRLGPGSERDLHSWTSRWAPTTSAMCCRASSGSSRTRTCTWASIRSS
jgi:hypothetical protein